MRAGYSVKWYFITIQFLYNLPWQYSDCHVVVSESIGVGMIVARDSVPLGNSDPLGMFPHFFHHISSKDTTPIDAVLKIRSWGIYCFQQLKSVTKFIF